MARPRCCHRLVAAARVAPTRSNAPQTQTAEMAVHSRSDGRAPRLNHPACGVFPKQRMAEWRSSDGGNRRGLVSETPEVQTLLLAENAAIPNHPDLPVVWMRGAVSGEAGAGAIRRLLEANGGAERGSTQCSTPRRPRRREPAGQGAGRRGAPRRHGALPRRRLARLPDLRRLSPGPGELRHLPRRGAPAGRGCRPDRPRAAGVAGYCAAGIRWRSEVRAAAGICAVTRQRSSPCGAASRYDERASLCVCTVDPLPPWMISTMYSAPR